MDTVPLRDEPKCLSDLEQCRLRHGLLNSPRMCELTAFVESIREEVKGAEIPYFDPLDGGVAAECLFLLEAPGPRAVQSGFVSRNNPDETAKNWHEMNRLAGIPRSRTITWNIVPWYIGEAGRIRAATAADTNAGLPYLRRLLQLLPRLRLLVLVGRKAERARTSVIEWAPHLEILEVPHPSPTFVNRAKHHRQIVIDGLLMVRRRLDQLEVLSRAAVPS